MNTFREFEASKRARLLAEIHALCGENSYDGVSRPLHVRLEQIHRAKVRQARNARERARRALLRAANPAPGRLSRSRRPEVTP